MGRLGAAPASAPHTQVDRREALAGHGGDPHLDRQRGASLGAAAAWSIKRGMRMCVCARPRAFVCVCVCMRARACVCVCVCACVRARVLCTCSGSADSERGSCVLRVSVLYKLYKLILSRFTPAYYVQVVGARLGKPSCRMHLAENARVFDFALDSEDLQAISEV